MLLLGVLGGLLAGVLATALLTRRAAVPAQSLSNGLRFLIPPPVPEWFNPSVDTVTLAVSTDGSRLAFITGVGAKRSIWVRALDDAEPHALPGTEGARSLFWSPDGLKLGFFAGGALSTIELGGRAAVRVCDVPVGSGGAATWGGDGTIAFTFTAGEAIYRVPASGGVASVWHERDVEQGESRLGSPQFLPGSREVVYTVRDGAGTSRLGSWSAGQAPRNLGPIASRFEFLDAATLVFARDGALVEQHFDRERGLIGAPTLIAPSVSSFRSSLWAGFAVSRAGTLLWKSAEDSNELVWFDRTGARGARVGTPGTVLEASVSGDGKTVLASRKRPELGTYDVWAYDLARGTESRLTSDPDSEFDALLSPDGKTLFYSAVHGPLPRIVVRDLASGAEHDLLAPGGFQMAQSITSDGRTLAFSRGTEQGFGFWTLALAGTAEPVPLAKGATGEEVRLSPDGSFAAYISDETGVAQLYVTRVAASAERAVVSANGARSIEWTADGKELLYLSEDRQVISIPVSVTPSLELGRPQTLFTIPATSSWVNMTASPDGRRFLANVRLSAAGEQPLNALVGHSAHH